jgi:hypothetical protein
MNSTQEGTVCHDFSIVNFTNVGLEASGAGAQNFQCQEFSVGYRAGSTTAQPIVWGTSAGGTILQRVTIVNPIHGGSEVPYCVNTGATLNLTIQTIHMEGCAKGVDVGASSAGVMVNGVTGDSTVTTDIYIENGAESISANQCIAAGSTQCLIDASIHNLTIFQLGHYFSLNGAYLTDDATRGLITYRWDGTSQTMLITPASGQATNLVSVLNTSSAVSWALGADGTMVTSGVQPQVAAPTGTYAVRPNDEVVIGNATSGAFTITLPSAVAQARSRYTIIKGDSSGNAITVATAAGAINGAPTFSLAGGALHAVTVVSDSANYVIQSLY